MSGRGRLFSWVVVTHAFLPQFAEMIPFTTGLVELEEDARVRLVTRIVDANPATLDFGQAMQVTFREVRFSGVEGEVTAPLFKPAEPHEH